MQYTAPYALLQTMYEWEEWNHMIKWSTMKIERKFKKTPNGTGVVSVINNKRLLNGISKRLPVFTQIDNSFMVKWSNWQRKKSQFALLKSISWLKWFVNYSLVHYSLHSHMPYAYIECDVWSQSLLIFVTQVIITVTQIYSKSAITFRHVWK